MANSLKWARYFFNTDFSTQATALEALTVKETFDATTGQALVDVLNALDMGAGKGLWTVTEGSEYTVLGAIVEYNDVTLSALPVKSSIYSKCVIIKLVDTTTVDLSLIFLQYNS
jgi:hypothetical protein